MDRLERSRRPLRNEIKKTMKELEDLLKLDPLPVPEVQACLLLLSSTVQDVEEVNTKIQDLMLDDDTITDDQMDAERETHLDTNDSKSDASYRTTDQYKTKIKLPTVELKKFGGDLRQWLGWWSQFQKIHQDTELDEADKFYYLLQYMEPSSEAQQMVESYPQTVGNYQKAVQALEERYGRQDLLLQVYLRELLSLVITNATTKEKLPLVQLHVQLETHIRSLSELKLDQADPATWLYPLVESCLSETTLRAWQRCDLAKVDGKSLTPPKTRLDLLMEFIHGEVKCEQQISLAQSGFRISDEKPKQKNKKSKGNTVLEEEVATAAGLLSTSAKGFDKDQCVFCDKSHPSDRCVTAQNKTLEERRKIVETKGVCFACLSGKHRSKKCKAVVRCIVCSKKHFPIMCPGKTTETSTETKRESSPLSSSSFSNSTTQVQSNASLQCSSDILLNTLLVILEGQNGKQWKVRIVGDTGSQRSWIKSALVKGTQCKKIGTEWVQSILFGGQSTAPSQHGKYQIRLFNLTGGSAINLEVLEKNQICGRIPKITPGAWTSKLEGSNISLSDLGTGEADIDVLIGSDYWAGLLTGKLFKLNCGLVAMETTLGWTLSGRISPNFASCYLSSLCSTNSADLSLLWSLEVLGVRDPIETKSEAELEKEAINIFKSTVTRNSKGRYVVALPWKNEHVQLRSNYNPAEKRLHTTTRRLARENKVAAYTSVFCDWQQEHFISKINEIDDTGHYLPHRPIYKDSPTTPVRPVFDASCKIGTSPSLNQCLYTGPNLMELIPSVLLRFRENSIGISADIRKAFQMIEVREEDRQYLKFLWWEDDHCSKIAPYIHNRVVFGLTSSPFLLSAVIQYHVQNSDIHDDLKEKLLTCFYVDSLATSVQTREEYLVFKNESDKVMSAAGMSLRQWSSTVQDLPVPGEVDDDIVPLLGLKWNRQEDTLSCSFVDFDIPDIITKRFMFSVAARIFDPIGILSPAVLLPKILLQEMWALKINWDQEIPIEAAGRFRKWMQGVYLLRDLHFPRCFQISLPEKKEIHIFADASRHACAAVVYVRSENSENVEIHLVLAKSRLAPLKNASIPRLELMACVLAVRLEHCVRKSLELDENTISLFWTDSSTAYTWITRDADWAVFVKNRVVEIRRSTQPAQWQHVPGKDNPADLPSRGCLPSQLLESKWWYGPEWLKEGRESWPRSQVLVNEQDVISELKKTSVLITTEEKIKFRHSSYQANVRDMAWIVRFIKWKYLKQLDKTRLTLPELRNAEKVIIRIVQEQAFPASSDVLSKMVTYKDQDGILRLKTRLLNREDKEYFKFPILLPKSHPLVDQLIMDFHISHCHGGIAFLHSKLREKYWIVQAKRVIRRVVRSCVTCQRHVVKSLETEPVALPLRRVNDCRPFDTTGVDLAGPLKLKDSSSVWIVIYTCAVYRCVHLDLVTSASTEVFLRSLERFINSFGRPNTLFSDNGTNFVGAANLFKSLDWKEIEVMSDRKKIHWVFNPPTAAWWGGFWERLVRTTKDLLKRMLKRARLSYDELLTCLSGVAATMNDRPLTVMTDDNAEIIPLTPGMFLRGQGMTHFPETVDAGSLTKSYQKWKSLQGQLQARFRKEYLGNLVMKRKQEEMRTLMVGDVVLVGADNRKRYEWPLGLIMELLPGSDAKIRLVRVKTQNGVFLRPIQRIYPLEITRKDEQPLNAKLFMPDHTIEDKDQRPEVEKFISFGRKLKQPVRYGQWFHLVKNI